MDLLIGLIFLLSRYVHIVCTTLIVGGTLFYEMVVPIAIADLKDEHQLAVFGRARWTFRQVIWGCTIALLASGVIESRQHWMDYSRPEGVTIEVGPTGKMIHQPPSTIERPGWWWVGHISTGILGVLIALSLTIGGTPPGHPVAWMRLNLVILMIVMFLGSATRQMRLQILERSQNVQSTGG